MTVEHLISVAGMWQKYIKDNFNPHVGMYIHGKQSDSIGEEVCCGLCGGGISKNGKLLGQTAPPQ